MGHDPGEKGYPSPPGWGLGVRPTTSARKHFYIGKTSKMPRMGRMEASFEGGQGQEGAVARYMDEWSLWIGVLLS